MTASADYEAIAHDFAQRLSMAIESNPAAPRGHGRQKWLKDKLQASGTNVSAEAVRKWFAGLTRPRPSVLKQIAEILEVDEAWLSLGATSGIRKGKPLRQNAATSGPVHLVAGLIKMSDGSVAFPDTGNTEVDIHAIIDAKQYSIVVRTPTMSSGHRTIAVPNDHRSTVVLVVVRQAELQYSLYRLPSELIDEWGQSSGAFIAVTFDQRPSLFVSGEPLRVLRSFSNLEGDLPAKDDS